MLDPPPVSVLSDGTITALVDAGRIVVRPWNPARVQPASVDLTLGDSFRVFHNHRATAIDLREPPTNLTEEVLVGEDEPFVIHPGEFCLGRTQEWVELPDDVVARIEGKALALDTPIPTPSGWTTMGEIQAGDEVFGPDGETLPVIDATEVMLGRRCREVAFCDGTTVVTDVEHEWEVFSNDDRRRGRCSIVTTGEMELRPKGSRSEYDFHVAQAAPVGYPRRVLPVDPYVLGAWIGDGTSSGAEITCAGEPILRELEYAGYAPRPARLRDLGLLGAKRIPAEYLTSGVQQRQALLEGLMDTDGHVDSNGRCELTTADHGLADQYFELVASLGHRPVIGVATASLDGEDCGLGYLITFTPSTPVFRLTRKPARQRTEGRSTAGRTVIGVMAHASVPVRCIQVGSARGVYLVSRAFIPTHNSSLGRLGLIVHATAGFCDPGWKGTLTLELNNLTRVPIRLYAGLPIAQLSFMTLDAPARRPYGSPELGSHYQGQLAATESRYSPTRPAVR